MYKIKKLKIIVSFVELDFPTGLKCQYKFPFNTNDHYEAKYVNTILYNV